MEIEIEYENETSKYAVIDKKSESYIKIKNILNRYFEESLKRVFEKKEKEAYNSISEGLAGYENLRNHDNVYIDE